MIKKKKILIIMMIGTLLVATACSGSKDEDDKKTDEENYYSGKLTADELNGGHIKLELCKNVTVDADITSNSKYKDGLKVYYTKRTHASDAANLKKFKKILLFLENLGKTF